MKYILFVICFLLGAINTSAQTEDQSEDAKTIEYRQKIGIDYSMPDFNTNSINGNVIGNRLAKMLQKLQDEALGYVMKDRIIAICCEQHEGLLYANLERFKIKNISKTGDVITVKAEVRLGKNALGIRNTDIVMIFNKGVSDSDITNDLFISLGRYIKDDQDGSSANSTSDEIVTNSVWDNWYMQVGVDMNLMFPHEHSVKDVFPNGKSFGINAAIGKWFSPEFGGRIKLTWNNGILPNDHNTWLAPYGKPGQNHREGGFVTFLGDIQFNLHNLIGRYRADRCWNLSVGPRFGGYLNIGKGYISGAHVLGLGAVNTFRLSDRWRLFADLGYHFVSSINGVSSGKGHGSNGFAEIAVGVEMDLSPVNKFQRTSSYKKDSETKVVKVNSFWDNWFVQAGLGMSLQNPYGTNFKNVFPNGSTYGINLGIGKWFTPMAGIRGGINWQNGIIINHHASYLESNPENDGDPDKHSFGAIYADMLFNLHHLIGGYDESRIWNAIIYPRLGIAQNFASSYKENPILGLGTEQTFKLSNKMKLYADLTYHVVTGGFLDGKFYTGRDGSNGWFDLNVGVQYELGQVVGWDKPGERPTSSVVASSHNWPRFIVNTGASVIVAFGVKTVLKKAIKEERPDHSDNESFPSGHATIAFAAARSLDKEFRKDCIWLPIAGYAAATAIGVERVVNERHHWYDVVAGAGIGFGAAELTWWLSDLMFGKGRNIAVGSSGNTLDVTYSF